MLEHVDRMLMAVRNRRLATESFVKLLGAKWLRDEKSSHLNGRASVLAVGASELELWEPASLNAAAPAAGLVAEHLQRFGEGLMFAGYATSQLTALTQRLASGGAAFVRENERIFVSAQTTFGFPMVISEWKVRPQAGPVSYFYEATNSLQTDWRVVARRYAELFGLEESRFSPINSPAFGYEGTLTLFAPTLRLDRIELSQTFADKPGSMRKFVERRGGDSFYMCFVEVKDFDGLRDRLLAAGATLTGRSGNPANERDTLWVHPKNLHGMLLGVSRTGFAWDWSGQPERVPALG